MNYVVADGKSNWLEGMILVCKLPSLDLREISTRCPLALYVIIGVAFWFYPGTHLMSLNSPELLIFILQVLPLWSTLVDVLFPDDGTYFLSTHLESFRIDSHRETINNSILLLQLL